MRALLDSNAEYRKVKIIRVDWDTFQRAPIVSELRIPRRSTLVVFRDGKEVSRLIAQTSQAAIEALFRSVI